MKKLIITMGAFTALAAPIATVVACGNNKTTPTPGAPKPGTPKPAPSEYKYPTLGEMFEDPMGLAKLFDAKIVDETASPSDALKTSLKAEIADDSAAAKVEGTNSSKYNTKVKWDAYVDAKLKMGELYNILQLNYFSNVAMSSDDINIENENLITSTLSKANMISKINSIWSQNKVMKTRYLDYINNTKEWLDAYYGLLFMRASSNAKNMFSLMGAISAVDGEIYKTFPDKKAFLDEIIRGGSMKMSEIAKGIKTKFSGKTKGFTKVIEAAGKIFNNKFYPGALWSLSHPSIGGQVVVNYILSTVGVSFAAEGEKAPIIKPTILEETSGNKIPSSATANDGVLGFKWDNKDDNGTTLKVDNGTLNDFLGTVSDLTSGQSVKFTITPNNGVTWLDGKSDPIEVTLTAPKFETTPTV